VKLIKNTGNNRVIDELRATLGYGAILDIALSAFSLFAFGEARSLLENLERCRLVIPAPNAGEPQLLGSEADRSFRNRLESATERREALARYGELAREIASLRARAKKETQMNHRVELNLTIRRLEAELTEIRKAL
jgi:hypothetical protein